jgi:hypothetical protein
VHTTNARITATVTGGGGSVLLAGAQLANESQDSSGFEMSFRDDLIGGGAAGVTSLNGLTGALKIAHGANTTVNVNGSTITIDAVSGSGTGLTAVAHDNSLAGSGTVGVPLSIAPGGVGNAQLGAGSVTAPKIAAGQVVTSVNGLHDAVTLAQGNNVTLTTVGNSIKIDAAGGGGGGLILPFSGPFSTGTGFAVHNTGSTGTSIEGDADSGSNGDGVHGFSNGTGMGVKGTSNGGVGVYGGSSATYGVEGITTAGNAGFAGVIGKTTGNWAGVEGDNASGNKGFLGGVDYGVFGTSSGSPGVYGQTTASTGGVHGKNGTSNNEGYLGGPDYGVFGTTALQNTPGVSGANSNASGWGVQGENTSHGTSGYLGGATYGVYGTSGSCVSCWGGIFDGALDVHTGAFAVEAGNASFHQSATILGDLLVGGNKNFVAPHPADPSKQIIFTCLEGNESGTYFRGTARTVNGFATIEVPESFRLVTSEKGLSAVATPVGELAVLAIVSQDLDKVVVQSSRDVTFHYVVNGVRAGFEDHGTIVENTVFVPRSLGDSSLSNLNAEAVRRLKASGILNPDGSINLDTAHRLGWDQRDGWKSAQEAAVRR